jgi:hypothetical protein
VDMKLPGKVFPVLPWYGHRRLLRRSRFGP